MRSLLLSLFCAILADCQMYAGDLQNTDTDTMRSAVLLQHETSVVMQSAIMGSPDEPPVIWDVEKDCFSVAFTVSAPSGISNILLDFQNSSNIAISVHDTLPVGAYRVELRMVDRSVPGYFVVIITDTQGISTTYSDTLYPAAGVLEVVSPVVDGDVLLSAGFADEVVWSNVLVRNTTADTLVLPILSCTGNKRFSVPPGQFPVVVPPGDTARVLVCHVPADAAMHRDTLYGEFECFSLRIPLVSKGTLFTPGEYTVEGNCGIPITLSGTRISTLATRVYPAPASDIAIVPVAVKPDNTDAVVLYNALGVAVAVGRFEQQGVEMFSGTVAGAWIFSVAELPAGAYYAVIPLGREEKTVVIPVAR